VKPDEAMTRALVRARSAAGRTFPNPSVGAVVFRKSGVLGTGATRPPGGPHAEVVALEGARRKHGARALRGASMAVTLEPCCHTGRTGPCTDALIEAGLERVYVGCADPHERVAGRGIRKLRAAGMRVEVGLEGDACRLHHRGFLSVCERKRPFVTLKLATSLDGRIATASGESRWITGPEARAFVHRLRARVDGLMVGSGTALADDPELTARRGPRVVHRPVRVLVDSKLRVPERARLYQPNSGASTWVLCGERARGVRRVEQAGAQIFRVPSQRGHLNLRAGLQALAKHGLTTLLVEGGGQLAAALLRNGLVDEIHWLLAPMLLGGDGRPALGPLELERLRDALVLREARTRRVGRDLHIHGLLGDD
jgi:diaminohydroxyphosphoribosylaminopyrimidine deaminase/5-amino-6-(5-phosphoribosylamino)uracil reductase